jgi:hypothetical protein
VADSAESLGSGTCHVVAWFLKPRRPSVQYVFAECLSAVTICSCLLSMCYQQTMVEQKHALVAAALTATTVAAACHLFSRHYNLQVRLHLAQLVAGGGSTHLAHGS